MTYYAEYRYNLVQFILSQKDNSLIERHKEVSSKTNTDFLNDYSIYKDKVLEQREDNPNHPFYDLNIPLNNVYSTDPRDLIKEIVEGEYEYVGTKTIYDILYFSNLSLSNPYLYNDVNIINDEFINTDVPIAYDPFRRKVQREETLVWEFVNKGYFTDSDDRDRWKYLYLPININYVNQINIPKIGYWNLDNQLTIDFLYPSKEYILVNDVSSWDFHYKLVTGGNTHPFLKGFVFTGRCVVQGYKGEILYEYSDIDGVYGFKYTLYLSNLKPLTLSYPLGVPKEGDLIFDECTANLIGLYPIYGLIPNEIGKYTGYRTTTNYHPNKTFYLYETFNRNTFLSEAIPHVYAKDFIDIALKKLGIYKGDLIIKAIDSKDFYYIKDDPSCGVVIQIVDFNCLPADLRLINPRSLFNDCTIVNECFNKIQFYKKLFNECNLIDDTFYLYECQFSNKEIEICLIGDYTNINQDLIIEDCSV